MTPPDFSTTSLRSWIQPRHLQPQAILELAERFASCPEGYHYIDDFMMPDRLEAIRQTLLEDGVLATAYKVYGDDKWVTEESFNQVSDSRRFIFEMIYQRPRPGREMARSVLMDQLFRREIQAAPFREWLAAITGLKVDRTGSINLKLLNQSHFLRWHSDQRPGRSLCMVLYLHDDWRPEYDGRFLMRRLDGGLDAVEPLGNRLVYFDPQVKTSHAIEAISEAAGDWSRLNYTVWFYENE